MTISLNVLGQYVHDPGALMSWLEQAKPAACVVMDNPALAAFAHAYVPLVIHRAFHSNDSSWTMLDDPQAWLDAHAKTAAGGVALQVLNEPNPVGQDRANMIDRMCRLIDLATARGITLVLGNFAVGTPHEKDIEAGAYDALIRKLAGSRHYLGLHEYFYDDPEREYPWLCGRFEYWLDRADTLGVTRPKIVITEHGHDLGNGGWFSFYSGDQAKFFDRLRRAQALYRKYGIAVCVFCYGYGAGNGWITFDVQGAVSLLDWLAQYDKENPMTPLAPTYPALPAANDPNWQSAILNPVRTYTFVRALPTLIGDIVGYITKNALGAVNAGGYVDGGYTWRPVRLPNGVKGWARTDVFTWVRASGKRVALDVPYASQWGWTSGRTGMCGAAADWMVIAADRRRRSLKMPAEITVDTVADWIGLKGDSFAQIATVRDALLAYGVFAQHTLSLTVARVKTEVDAGYPVVCLVQYSHLSGRADQKFRGGHILVAVGYDDTSIICNDPDYAGAAGRQVAYPIAEFEKALSQTAEAGNAPNQGVFVRWYEPVKIL